MQKLSSHDEGPNGTQATRWSADELIPFGKYILLNKLNSGATAAVYRAKIRGEAGFERLVAVKRILPHMAGDPEFVNTFVREAKTAARLNHTNICPIYELGKVGESLYMAMEWVAGRDLGAITRRLHRSGIVMPPAIAAWIAARLCDALDYAHTLKDARGKATGIIHRDLSPTNIVISYEGQVKLIDFGLAKAAGRAQQTNVDALKAKLGYMSPELVKGRPPDARSDVFGVGVCLYEMVTARRLFAGKDDMATLKMVSSASVPPPSALVEDAPEELELIIMHALEREPEQRWQTAGEMGQALSAFIQQHEPMFSQRQVGDFMLKLFQEEMIADQKRVNELLEASHDPRVIEDRRRFFASSAGAAAMAKAEVARRMSTQPPAAISGSLRPMTSDVAARQVPKAPALPRVAQDAGIAGETAPGAAPFEDEPTNFFDADKQPSMRFEDEATAFFDGSTAAKAAEAQLGSGLHELAPSLEPDPPDLLEDDDAMGYASEKTEFVDGEALADMVVDEKQPEPAARTGLALPDARGFEEEATHIFFNQEDGLGMPELLAEELDAAPAPMPVLRTLTVPQQAPPAPQAPSPAAAAAPQARAAQRAPQAVVQPPRQGPRTGRTSVKTLEMRVAARKKDKLSSILLIVGLAMLGLAIIGLIARTHVGIALGLRKPVTGAIEVRTTPAVGAAIKLDGVYRGRAPLRMDGVRAGRRLLELEAPGYHAVAREIDLAGGTTAMVDIALTARAAAAPALPTAPTTSATPPATGTPQARTSP